MTLGSRKREIREARRRAQKPTGSGALRERQQNRFGRPLAGGDVLLDPRALTASRLLPWRIQAGVVLADDKNGPYVEHLARDLGRRRLERRNCSKDQIAATSRHAPGGVDPRASLPTADVAAG
jgi:hypothetical protein